MISRMVNYYCACLNAIRMPILSFAEFNMLGVNGSWGKPYSHKRNFFHWVSGDNSYPFLHFGIGAFIEDHTSLG